MALSDQDVNYTPSAGTPIEGEENLNPEISEELQGALLNLRRKFDIEDRSVRNIQIRISKKLEEYFKGIQVLFWDDLASDWRSPQFASSGNLSPNANIDADLGIYPKIVNIYRAYGESIIAALTTGLPYVRFYPEDADNSDDITTGKAFSRVAEKIENDNKAQLLFIKALYILFNQYFVAFYNYAHEDEAYGTYPTPVYGIKTLTNNDVCCPNCLYTYGSYVAEKGETIQAEAEETVEPQEERLQEIQNPEMEMQENPNPLPPQICPQCQMTSSPQIFDQTFKEPFIKSYENNNKVRECLEVYGHLNVKVPSYVTDVKHAPYLALETEIHISQAQAMYPDKALKFTPTSSLDTYDRWGRTNIEYTGGTEANLLTFSRWWFRPWAFNNLGFDKAEVAQLKEKFPEGAYVCFMNDIFCEATSEKLDDHWSIIRNPLAPKIHAEPIGYQIAPIQEMKNELTNLTMQTIQFGIGETFADPSVLDFDAYRDSQNAPGVVFPAVPRQGENISNAFYTSKTASLSREVDLFRQSLDQDGQFVSGAFPSIFGGTNQGGSKTLGEYQESRSQALQRLSLSWKMISNLWAETLEKACTEYINNLSYDEKFVKRDGESYVNIWIKRAELAGKIGKVEADVSEQFPISWQQKTSKFFETLQLNNQAINTFLFSPDNAEFVAEILGFPELAIPFRDDRTSQLDEIKGLLQGQPTQANTNPDGSPLQPGQPPVFQPSIGIQPEVDNHQVHVQICRKFLNSDQGRTLRVINPAGYENAVAHMNLHISYLNQQMMLQQQQGQEQGNNSQEESNNVEPPPTQG